MQVNRSSLLVPEQVTKPQEVNGTNGKAALPVTDTVKEAEVSTDSEQDEAGDTDDPGNSKSLISCRFLKCAGVSQSQSGAEVKLSLITTRSVWDLCETYLKLNRCHFLALTQSDDHFKHSTVRASNASSNASQMKNGRNFKQWQHKSDILLFCISICM